MKTHTQRQLLVTALASVGLLAFPAAASPLALSDTPLIVSTSIEPNVMLLIDNSGSMNNIMWPSNYLNTDGQLLDYDNSVTQPRWQYRNSGGNWTTMTDLMGNISRGSFRRGNCASNFFEFRLQSNTSVTKCLRLPDPVGSNSTRFTGNYMNWLLQTFPNGSDLRNGVIPDTYLMEVARDVSNDIVSNTAGMRFGVARFNAPSGGVQAPGGRVIANCGSSLSTLQTQINGLTAETWTPLAESLYEVTRYFRGMSSYYNSGLVYTSPIQYRCQKNFTIVLTDGLPTYDYDFPTNDPDDIADSTRSLPNWDNLAPSTTSADYPNFPQYSDGFNPYAASSDEGHSLFLDDIAKFGWDIDMRKGGTDAAGVSFDDPQFSKQNMFTYTVGFTVANQMLEDAAEYGNGLYFTANDANQLKDVLEQALRDIQGKLGSSASAAANAGFVGTNTKVYQARFNSTDWSGQLLAFAIDGNPTSATYGMPLTNGPGPDGSLWDAGGQIPAWSSRVILTNKAGGIPFRWNQFSSTEQSNYFNGDQALLQYLRGRSDTSYRSRSSLLGDIVHSAPVFVGSPAARYPDSLESSAYSTFRTSNASRSSMLYVGANDGMLHGFNAETGAETLAFIPSVLLPHLKLTADADYRENHRFFVDGSPTVVDAFINGAWRTVLVGGLNNGGQAIYALDITDPNTFSEANAANLVLWEFTDADDADLGYTYSQPAIVKLQDGRWAAIFGNGYNNTVADGNASSSGNAALFIVDLEDGSLIKKISTNVGRAQDPTSQNRPNGLATPAPVDIDGNYKVDYVYAGDLFGNMWKFDLSSSNPNQWSLAYKLYEACATATCSPTNRQPITARPSVTRHPSGDGQIILFGTGKYLEQIDNVALNGGIQSFYGIWDRGTAAAAPTGRSQLQQQSIIAEQNFSFTQPDNSVVTYPLRVTSDNTVNWTTARGWYLDLVSPPSVFQGERQVTNSVVRNNRVIFTTLIPTTDPCRPGGDSWLMELDVATGARLKYTPFDLDGDGRFSTSDWVTITVGGVQITVPVSGIKLDGGAAAAPSIMAAMENTEFKYISTADGLETVKENPGPLDTGRQTWRQLGRD